QLENYIKRFLVLPDHHALFSELNSTPPVANENQPDTSSAALSLLGVGAVAAERAEQELVRRVLEETRGNRKQAARRMNISYKALLNKLKRWSGPETRTTSEQTSQREASEAA